MVVGKCLESIGKPAEPVVCQALTNQDEAVRQWAIANLAAVTDDVGLYVTRIEPRLHDPSDAVRAATVDAVGNQTDAPELAVPLLVEALKDSAVSPNAAGALANFGTNALVAFPILTNLVEHGGIKLSDAALKTLTVIAPDQALTILLRRFRSPDIVSRRVAFRLLCRYPMTPPVESALQTAAADSDPVIAKPARIILTENHQNEHPLEAQFPDDPSYAGKPLGEWLKMHENNGDYAYSQAASNAIHQIGTNAIPALLRRLIYVEPPFGLPAYEVNRDAMRGFILLGDQATPALPQLQALLDGTNQNLVLLAMVSSLGTGTNAIPVLSKALTNQFASVRDESANCLAHSIAERFSERRQEIISLLTNLLSDSDSDVRRSVKGDLQDLNLQPLPSRK
jgi:HEAT repeat protein